jgi:1-deoxyxylulose-5-phosphate synthase
VAAARGVPRAQVALAWLSQQPAVTSPIIGVTKPEHLTDAVASLDLELTADELDALSAPYQPHGIAGHR